MADLRSQERLFPSLLDRLTDDAPEKKIEPRDRRIFSVQKLRVAVLRDLAWLLNTCHLAASEDLTPYPLVEKSVVNHGIPDLTGRTISGLEIVDVEMALRRAILDFEPRILPHTLQVRAEITDESKHHHNSVAFEIEGELWARPIPERLFLRTELDLETGSVSLTEG